MIKTFLNLIRIKHYVKNAVCFVPLIFSLNFTNPILCFNAAAVFMAFCLISSSVYIFNDLFDIKYDKLSKEKSKRPIPAGKIRIKTAIFIMFILLLAGLTICAFLNTSCLFAAVCYIVLNIFYTLYLKNIEIIDAACIASGFILRILAGCAAISVLPSPLVILLTFFVSMFFTFSKRLLELESKDGHQRKSIEKFTPKTLNQFVCANAILSISFYFAYVMDTTTIERAGTGYLYISAIPFSLIIFRLLFLANTNTIALDPSDFIYKDKMVQALFLLYFVILFSILAL